MPQSFACIHCHLVFSTKDREPLLVPDLTTRLYEYMGGICRNHNDVLVAAGGRPDHVHLIVSFGKQTAAAEAVRIIKSNSSRWIHETFPQLRGFAWQNGYGAFAMSYSSLDDVKRYIHNQDEHHRVRTFKEEFLAMLDKHNLPYDERYIWD